jgi:hypothetical protein
VAAVRTVPAFDEVEDGHPSLGLVLESCPLDQLMLEGGEEAAMAASTLHTNLSIIDVPMYRGREAKLALLTEFGLSCGLRFRRNGPRTGSSCVGPTIVSLVPAFEDFDPDLGEIPLPGQFAHDRGQSRDILAGPVPDTLDGLCNGVGHEVRQRGFDRPDQGVAGREVLVLETVRDGA